MRWVVNNDIIANFPKNGGEFLKYSFGRGGGIGRRNGLKIRRSNPCGFESHPRH